MCMWMDLAFVILVSCSFILFVSLGKENVVEAENFCNCSVMKEGQPLSDLEIEKIVILIGSVNYLRFFFFLRDVIDIQQLSF